MPHNKNERGYTDFTESLSKGFFGDPQLQLLRQLQPFNLDDRDWDRIELLHHENYNSSQNKPKKRGNFKALQLSRECKLYLDFYFNEYVTYIVRRHVILRNGITRKSLIDLERKLSRANDALAQLAAAHESRFGKCALKKMTPFKTPAHALADLNIFPLDAIGEGWEASSPNSYIVEILLRESLNKNPLGAELRDLRKRCDAFISTLSTSINNIPKNRRGSLEDQNIKIFIGRILSVYSYSGGKNTYTANCISFISAVLDVYFCRAKEIVDRSALKSLSQRDEKVIEKRIQAYMASVGKSGLTDFINEITDFYIQKSSVLESLSLYDVPLPAKYPFSDKFKNPRSLTQILSDLDNRFPSEPPQSCWQRRKPKRRKSRICLRFFSDAFRDSNT